MAKTFTVQNYKGIREITLHPTGSLVVVAGANGAGKSSFIDAIAELVDPRGVRLTPKPIRDGEAEARAEFVDDDLQVRIVRTWKKDDAGKLEVFALDGAKYSKPAEIVAELTGGLIFDPVAFLNLDEKRQRDALLEKVDLPFDIDEVAREKAGAEQRRLEAGRDVRRLQGALASMPNPLDAPAEEVSGAAVLAEIEAAQDLQRHRERVMSELDDAAEDVASLTARIAKLTEELEEASAQVKTLTEARDALPAPVDIEPLREKLAAVDETNAAVRARREYAKVADECAAAETAQAAANRELEAIEKRKREGLAAATFPVDGLSVDENGVTFDGVPFTQVNSAMRRRVAFAIATAGDPKLRLVIIKDGDLLDADSLAAIRELADERGYTVLVERDRDESRQIGFTIEDGALA
ncbi:Chromosome partition protein Smc [Microbacterium ginsengisoli]|uniref:Chromosome partition protein Smc n=1 Tax=Microbacterium ginsengisoli TaxID=400772 RepID=A0A0F0LXR4_9MICO|nr:ATP-binding protein [Microbacterium ginsengisoli]KJL37080.1 Chromosome partition protein Smc [Microbacterium ginsengisoli]